MLCSLHISSCHIGFCHLNTHDRAELITPPTRLLYLVLPAEIIPTLITAQPQTSLLKKEYKKKTEAWIKLIWHLWEGYSVFGSVRNPFIIKIDAFI